MVPGNERYIQTTPRSRTRRRGGAASPRRDRFRRYRPVADSPHSGILSDRYVPPRGRTTPYLPVGERGGASFLREETRRRLIVERQGIASSPCWKTKRRVVLPLEDEAAPRPCAGRRGIASFPRGKTRRHLVPARGDADFDGTA
ncbi:hypothetical protein GW17_00020237 [Ensete ventricosum]|nr:hypothetical protein GW17_00020237 [Ensete ventricosum]